MFSPPNRAPSQSACVMGMDAEAGSLNGPERLSFPCPVGSLVGLGGCLEVVQGFAMVFQGLSYSNRQATWQEWFSKGPRP